MGKQIAYNTIIACKMGNEDALREILKHYEPLIMDAARSSRRNSDGTYGIYIDEEIKAFIESELSMKIMLKYDPTKQPRTKYSAFVTTKIDK